MKRNLRGWIVLFVLFGTAVPSICLPQGPVYGTVSFIRARPLSMGAAFMAVEDDLAAIGYNPGTFHLYQKPKAHRLTLFFNPVGPVVAARDWNSLVGGRSLVAEDVLGLVGLLLKGAAFTAGALNVGVLFGEQALLPPRDGVQPGVFDSSTLLQNQSTSAILRLKPADRVAIGVAGTLISTERTDGVEHGYSLSYGVWLRPAQRVQIGFSYLNMSRPVTKFRMPLERLQNDSVNLGVALQPTSSTVVAIDLRNVGEQQDQILNQTHFGIEQTLFSQIALRGGFYDRPEKDTYVITGGIGLLSTDTFFGDNDHFGHPSFVFNYAFVYEARGAVRERWHLLSFILRI